MFYTSRMHDQKIPNARMRNKGDEVLPDWSECQYIKRSALSRERCRNKRQMELCNSRNARGKDLTMDKHLCVDICDDVWMLCLWWKPPLDGLQSIICTQSHIGFMQAAEFEANFISLYCSLKQYTLLT